MGQAAASHTYRCLAVGASHHLPTRLFSHQVSATMKEDKILGSYRIVDMCQI